MYPLFKRKLRPFSVIILFFFTWFCIEPWNYAVWAQSQPNQPSVLSDQGSASKKFEDALKAANQTIEDLDQKITAGKDIAKTLDSLRGYKKRLEAEDLEIRSEFNKTEAFLKEKGIPADILDRHQKAVSDYDANFKQLKANLDSISLLESERKDAEKKKNKTLAKKKLDELKARIKTAKDHLKEKVKEPPHTPLDPNNLPHRTPKIKPRKPRLKKEEFAELNNPIQLAFNGDPQDLLLVQSNNDLPTSADLAETIEIQFTQEIKDLASSLNHNPVKIYNWVRNNIDFVPTYGSIQGANMCLMTKQCNDMDTASLLIALLRTSGISARYVIGTIEVPIDKAMNWVGGFTDAKSALDFISSGGTPVTSIISGGKISSAQIEHVWVEAYVDYIPSRGAIHKQGDTWIPMDGSFKQYTYTQGIDLQTAVPFNTNAFLSQVQSTAITDPTAPSATGVDSAYVQTTVTDYQNQIQNYLAQNNPNATVGDVLGTKDIKKKDLSILPATLPYKTNIIGIKYSQVPDSLRHKITVKLTTDAFFGPDFTYTAALPELAGKRITISYDPATQSDQDLINRYADQFATSIPAYLVNLKPILKINGTIISSGASIGMGQTQTLNITFTSPSIGQEIVSHTLLAGDYSAIGLDLDQITSDILQKRIDLNDFSEPVGEMLHQTLLSYWGELDAFNKIISSQAKVATIRHPSEGLAASKVTTTELFGAPNQASYKSRTLDISRDLQTAIHKGGDKTKGVSYFTLSGVFASSLEGLIFDQLFGGNLGDSVSAARILELSNNQGIPIYRIDSNNVISIFPILQVKDEVKTNIQNAVNAGKVAFVPKQEITHISWTGTGYIIQDPDTGVGAYLISGGLAGGADSVQVEAVYPLPQIPATPIAIFLITAILAAGAAAVGAPAILTTGGVIIAITLTSSIAEATTTTFPTTGADPRIGALAALIALIIATITGISDSTNRTRPAEDWVVLRHYTNADNVRKILFKDFAFIALKGSVGIFFTKLFLEPNAPLDPRIPPEFGSFNKDYIHTALELPLGNSADGYVTVRINRNAYAGEPHKVKDCALQYVQPCDEWLFPTLIPGAETKLSVGPGGIGTPGVIEVIGHSP